MVFGCFNQRWRPVFTQVLKAFMPLESVRVLDLCSAPGSKVLGREASIGTVEFVFMISYDGKLRFTRACNPARGVTTIIQLLYAIKLPMFMIYSQPGIRWIVTCYSQSINASRISFYNLYHLVWIRNIWSRSFGRGQGDARWLMALVEWRRPKLHWNWKARVFCGWADMAGWSLVIIRAGMWRTSHLHIARYSLEDDGVLKTSTA